MENNRKKFIRFFSILFLFVFIFYSLLATFYSLPALAEDYSSPSFIIRAPVVSIGGSFSTSTSFQAQGSLGQIITGINSGLNFQQAVGFLYFSTGTTTVSTPETPVTPAAAAPSGGGGTVSVITTGANFSGRAYPLSKVTILKDGQIAAATIAGPDSNFSISLTGLSDGNYNFSVLGEDKNGRHSTLFTFPVFITRGVIMSISGIFIAPTISVDKNEVKRGDNIGIFGQSISNSDITIAVNSENEIFLKTKADKDGVYLYDFDTSELENGSHFTKSKAALGSQISVFSKTVGFSVGFKNVFAAEGKYPAKGDLTNDRRVNIVDFSVAAYWYKRPSPPQAVDLNGDGKVDLTDFSIMAYYWTG